MKYKIIKRGEPGVAGGGTLKYYATPHYSAEIDLFGLSKKLSIRSTITRIDAVAVTSGLVDLIAEELVEGRIVRLGNLGSFRISINSSGEDTAIKVTAGSIKKSRVLFRPGLLFKKNLRDLSFEKAEDLIVNPDDRPAAA